MNQLELNLVQSIIELMYEPDVIQGSEKCGDYNGLTVERRSCFKAPDSEDSYDPFDYGYELFITTINDQKYIGLYRTWVGEYGDRDGRVEALISSYIGSFKYGTERLTEVNRLIKKFSMLLSIIQEI